jgi:hypothetical protein
MPTTTTDRHEERLALPTVDELDAAWRTLADAEEAIRKVAGRVFAVVNVEDSSDDVLRSISFADIGALLTFVHECRDLGGLTEIAETLRKLERTALDDLAAIARTGERDSVPRYDAYGNSNYRHDDVLRSA